MAPAEWKVATGQPHARPGPVLVVGHRWQDVGEELGERPSVWALVGLFLAFMAPLVLGGLFLSAYEALDRRDPAEKAALALHASVLVVGSLMILAGGIAALRTHRRAFLGLLGGVLGLGLAGIASVYSSSECWVDDEATACVRDGGATTALVLAMVFLLALAGLSWWILSMRSRGAAFAGLLTIALLAASAYVVASAILLSNLDGEALAAHDANRPNVHVVDDDEYYYDDDFIPGPGLLATVAIILVAAFARRRRT